jgi:hypothetical protein
MSPSSTSQTLVRLLVALSLLSAELGSGVGDPEMVSYDQEDVNESLNRLPKGPNKSGDGSLRQQVSVNND